MALPDDLVNCLLLCIVSPGKVPSHFIIKPLAHAFQKFEKSIKNISRNNDSVWSDVDDVMVMINCKSILPDIMMAILN